MIKYRLFIAMLAATGAAVICMFLIMQWSIGRGFLAYVNTMEKERMDRLAEILVHSYTEHGNWQFLKDSPETWFRIVAGTRGVIEMERLGQRDRTVERDRDADRTGAAEREEFLIRQARRFANHSGAFPQRLAHRFEMRVILLDAQHQKVMGPPEQARPYRDAAFQKLLVGGKVVGYLGMLPRLHLTDQHQLLFVKRQKVAMGMIAAVMLLVSAALSMPLANRLVSPIKLLASSMHRLASGKFDTRVEINSADELGQLGADFNTLALTLEKNEAARRHWVADISHELRTPLAVLRGEIEAIQDGIRLPTADSMRSLHGEVMQLSRLVDDLYQLSLHDIGGLNYRKVDMDLKEALCDALDLFRSEFAQKGIRLSESFSDSCHFPLFADPERLHQLFDNLLENSLKYTDPQGELAVRLERHGQRATLHLEDTAPGVPEADLERLFDRLYRVENSRNRALGGAGLGLSLCKNIVEAHEGTITAHPSPLGGVQIRIDLPLRRS
ncbi:ATP-binding protein [Geomesophilobacter sediminis]|nr:ATP-binding protein [Geomesophilobacter sediminis]